MHGQAENKFFHVMIDAGTPFEYYLYKVPLKFFDKFKDLDPDNGDRDADKLWALCTKYGKEVEDVLFFHITP